MKNLPVCSFSSLKDNDDKKSTKTGYPVRGIYARMNLAFRINTLEVVGSVNSEGQFHPMCQCCAISPPVLVL